MTDEDDPRTDMRLRKRRPESVRDRSRCEQRRARRARTDTGSIEHAGKDIRSQCGDERTPNCSGIVAAGLEYNGDAPSTLADHRDGTAVHEIFGARRRGDQGGSVVLVAAEVDDRPVPERAWLLLDPLDEHAVPATVISMRINRRRVLRADMVTIPVRVGRSGRQ